ncbi:type IV pilus modification PilV family protein [Tepidimicrobium xylanilyticum]|uniref:Prepilin-type N-terminal cleavage/methylation domain-containing protein n=1 Tax=Tepidimicrobium xylanilyticum TaxID=1123352 RepID=A0A1H3CQV2_9FIRM|nr:prepilin-type N-terminal cleavage/methylation domain-containing protein [Tepidimicrobium xylanilyticum]GMG97700.1 hypothetical protein EN5CB1_25260 [Tepidimicrobium xylanilyticum]SDX55934.1 hypothetical protein SAMN05660923_02512 [Tepidimicrobium xylanilyticum]
MKNSKGFSLIELLLGIFLTGIIVITFFPIINTSLNNIYLAKEKVLMLLEIESIIERIKAYDYLDQNEYIFDMKIEDLINILCSADNISIILPLDNDDMAYEYSCKIYKKNRGDQIWELSVELKHGKNTKIKEMDVITIIFAPTKGGMNN